MPLTQTEFRKSPIALQGLAETTQQTSRENRGSAQYPAIPQCSPDHTCESFTQETFGVRATPGGEQIHAREIR